MTYYVVKYTGPFGFIKPWTAVRDGITFSQQFLTPSTIEGIRQLLGTKDILRHRLSYQGMSRQQERIQSPGYDSKIITGQKGWKRFFRSESIIDRTVLISPILHLAFSTKKDAEIAFGHHLCLCRNEDLIFPIDLFEMNKEQFDLLPGFELEYGDEADHQLLVGYNRYKDAAPMYGTLQVIGDPLNQPEE